MTWEDEFDKRFIMDTDNGTGPKFLFRINEDGSVSIALPYDVKAFIRQQVEVLQAEYTTLREHSSLIESDRDKWRNQATARMKRDAGGRRFMGLKGELAGMHEVVEQCIEITCSQYERADAAEADNTALRERAETAEKLLHDLTPMGSDFAGKPQRCYEWVRNHISDLIRHVVDESAKRQEAEAKCNRYRLLYDERKQAAYDAVLRAEAAEAGQAEEKEWHHEALSAGQAISDERDALRAELRARRDAEAERPLSDDEVLTLLADVALPWPAAEKIAEYTIAVFREGQRKANIDLRGEVAEQAAMQAGAALRSDAEQAGAGCAGGGRGG